MSVYIESGSGSGLRGRAFEFACRAVDLHRFVYKREPSLREVSRQAMTAATSIGANLEEAEAAQSRADFVSKCNISLKEAREARYWLRILERAMRSKRLSRLINESTELIAILTTIVKRSRR